MDTIQAISLKGHCSIALCLQYLREAAQQLDAMHQKGEAHGSVSLQQVTVEDTRFVLTQPANNAAGTPAGDIWQLAASAMELVLGNPIFNGAGEAAQTERTPVPCLPQPEAEPLNRLLQRCLMYDKKQRPLAKEVAQEVEKIAAQTGKPQRKRRPASVLQPQQHTERIDMQWPEQIWVKTKQLMLLLPLLCFALGSYAQTMLDPTEEETTIDLMNVALTMRKNDAKSWNDAKEKLQKRLDMFTLMNKLNDDQNDKFLSGKSIKSFGFNRLVDDLKNNKLDRPVTQNTGKGLLDGMDGRFNYGIVEKGIKKGCTATYLLEERIGKQVLVIIPYDKNQAYAPMLYKNEEFIPAAGVDQQGVTYYVLEGENELNQGDVLTLKIANRNPDQHEAFVIINHTHKTR